MRGSLKGSVLAGRVDGPKSPRFRGVKAAGIGMLSVLIATGLYLGYLQWSGNFHSVVAGELYRSAQPSPAQIQSYVHDRGIRTIVNLRGEDDQADWYRDEIDAAQRLGVRHIDFKMSSSQILTSERAKQLLTILRTAQKPILIHCRSGADRTGLVSVLYSRQIAGIDERDAEHQLSIAFGHIGIPWLSPTFAMDESWERLEDELPQQASSQSAVIAVR